MQTIMQTILQESREVPKLYTLEDELLLRVTRKINIIRKIRMFSFLSIGSLSGVSLYVISQTLLTTITNSGIGNYIHLIIEEDIITLSLISGEMFYSILETLPTMTITLLLGVLFMLLISINGIMLTLQQKTLYTNN